MTAVELVTLLLGVVAPLLVGLVTGHVTPPGQKAILLATLSALVGVGQGFLDGPPDTVWDWKTATVAAFVTWVIAVATHYGLWKPTGVSDKLLSIGGAKTP